MENLIIFLAVTIAIFVVFGVAGYVSNKVVSRKTRS